ncbi:undecaprenyl diphosphate synthase [Arachidicoccus rhizosphaerae]|jgi:undecaprenyl diphosphate synthase|uniref:Isoprenyl transferase n=1 Tax=Arachidicoccus rhizosphaerae TaxID=551991 RepID=A0A1H4CA64_9BACT|nr:isoprenyl transferase [Arachidicoccus rhizosphaerae]SEA57238.1 undecaprenyl diphosphate synthase [Arachidicoccus rhizosphaerae]
MEKSQQYQIDPQKLPRHVAIIMDGNGRWAQQKGEDRLYGHYHGVQSVRTVTEVATELGIEYLTLYAFSTENWDRPSQEVAGLMQLLIQTVRKEVPDLNKNNVRLHVIGDMEMLPEDARQEMQEALEETAANTGVQLILALSYSSRWELTRAARLIAQDVQAGKLSAEKIGKDTLAQYLTTAPYPDPELMIRTGGENRISNFLLYQLAYAELYFTDIKWPDFNKDAFLEAISAFQMRERRFGKTGEQVKNS